MRLWADLLDESQGAMPESMARAQDQPNAREIQLLYIQFEEAVARVIVALNNKVLHKDISSVIR